MNESKLSADGGLLPSGQKSTRRKLIAILKMAFAGAALADSLILWLNIAPRISKSVGWGKVWEDCFGLLPWLVAIPTIAVSEALGLGQGPATAYVANALIGASIFGLTAAIWQFAIKQ
jgi:hypothetical protein